MPWRTRWPCPASPGRGAPDPRRLLRVDERHRLRRLELTHDVLTRVVKDSRDNRRAREAREKAEIARREAEAREAQARRQLRRSRWMAALFGCLTLAAVGAAVWAVISQKAAVEATHEAQRALADADYREAWAKLASGRVGESVPLLAHATRLDPAYLPGQGLLVDVLLRRSWPLSAPELRHERGSPPRSSAPTARAWSRRQRTRPRGCGTRRRARPWPSPCAMRTR